jgi:hypothetical protein
MMGEELTGEFINDPDELAWPAFWHGLGLCEVFRRDQVSAAIGGTERDDVGHQPGTAARSRTRDIARRS